MKKILIIIVCLGLTYIVITSFKLHSYLTARDKYPTDLGDCIQKYKSDWGKPCAGCTSTRDTYVVSLKNSCDLPLDIKIAVQNKNKTWRIFEKENFGGGDSLIVFSCEGTGKYLKWTKKAGDREIVFPSNMEIGKTYNK
mgnify:CR=1 FL=1